MVFGFSNPEKDSQNCRVRSGAKLKTRDCTGGWWIKPGWYLQDILNESEQMILLSMKYVADLIVKLGRRLVEAAEFFQGIA